MDSNIVVNLAIRSRESVMPLKYAVGQTLYFKIKKAKEAIIYFSVIATGLIFSR
jgi:hypothetical protein